jgi:hypothetical protein
MIRVGFIVEDKPFQKLIISENFKSLLTSLNIENTGVFISPDGRDRLLRRNEKIQSLFSIFEDRKTNYIFVLVDKESDPCITYSKESIITYSEKKQINIIASKTVESWFLADSDLLTKLFNIEFSYDNPENIDGEPFDILKNLFEKHTARGLSKKRNRYANYLINNGFSIINAAKHPKCHSAKYFLEKLSQLNSNS